MIYDNSDDDGGAANDDEYDDDIWWWWWYCWWSMMVMTSLNMSMRWDEIKTRKITRHLYMFMMIIQYNTIVTKIKTFNISWIPFQNIDEDIIIKF